MVATALSMSDSLPLAGAGARHADDELVARCRDGDAAAYRQIYHEHRGRVYRVVARMISNDADRDEVVQDVFLQVVRSLPSFRGGSRLSTWIHRVAVNVTLQHIRRKKSRVRLQLVGEAPERRGVAPESPGTPEDAAILAERRAAVQRALDNLSPKKRVALVLADFEGLPSKEIAEIVDAPVLTIRTRLFYARREFYEQLAGEASFAGVDLRKGRS